MARVALGADVLIAFLDPGNAQASDATLHTLDKKLSRIAQRMQQSD